MAAIFLTSRDTDVEEIINSVDPIRAELTRLAALNLDAQSRQAFVEFLENDVQSADNSSEMITFAKWEREFGRILGVASRNSVLSLFLDILYDLAAHIRRERNIFLKRPDRILAYREQRRRVIEAILDGDAALAEMLAHRVSEINRRWMLEDHGSAGEAG